MLLEVAGHQSDSDEHKQKCQSHKSDDSREAKAPLADDSC